MKYAKVVKGDYVGRTGKATMPNEYGLVMFYPNNYIVIKKEK